MTLLQVSSISNFVLFVLQQGFSGYLNAQVPDREYHSSYTILVQAVSLTLSTTKSFIVSITDVNDNSPNFSASPQNLTVAENEASPSGPLTTQGISKLLMKMT